MAGVGAGVVLVLVVVAVVARSGTTPPSGAAVATTSPATDRVIFRDDFSSEASGWGPYGAPETGRYANGAYRVDQEVGKLVLGQAHRMDVLASRAPEPAFRRSQPPA